MGRTLQMCPVSLPERRTPALCEQEDIMTDTTGSLFPSGRICTAGEAAECFKGKKVNDLSGWIRVSFYAAKGRETEGCGAGAVYVPGDHDLSHAYIIIDPDVLAGLRKKPKAMMRASEMFFSECDRIRSASGTEGRPVWEPFDVASALEGGWLSDLFGSWFGKKNSDLSTRI